MQVDSENSGTLEPDGHRDERTEVGLSYDSVCRGGARDATRRVLFSLYSHSSILTASSYFHHIFSFLFLFIFIFIFIPLLLSLLLLHLLLLGISLY